MSAPANTVRRIESAVAAMGAGPLTEEGLQRCVAPLFSRMRAAWRDRIYLANHSLGRPLDASEDDVREGMAAWYADMGGAWAAWGAEMQAYRGRLARLLGAARADSIVPKTSAGQGLRAILNTYDRVARVVATRGEFDSLDVILREYARRGRIALTLVEPRADGLFATADICAACARSVDLVVVSQVIFNTGQRIADLPAIVAATHAAGGRVLLDVYHALGVYPFDVAALDADFVVGGAYKYLRGGPGACFLYLHPRHLDGSLRTLDTGWFAKRDPFAYLRPDPPELGAGGDAFLESTPAVLPIFQARAGQVLLLALGVARVRAHSLAQQQRLVALLAQRGIPAAGGTEDRGAFVTVGDTRAEAWSKTLADAGVVTDARGRCLRLCPDVLTTEAELVAAADAVARAAGQLVGQASA
ncbi:MAG: aminotransferase class V-fold PLP-dependent enzyme [Casimicrobiaceae bacterium]